jgi:hypothetical protein
MIETVTPTSNSILDNETDEMMSVFTESEIDFYESIKPSLNQLAKNPSSESVQNILNISKSL